MAAVRKLMLAAALVALPAALHAMIAVLAATPDYKRRVLAAGEMRELGTTSPELHREAGAFAAQTGKIDWVFGVAGDGAHRAH